MNNSTFSIAHSAVLEAFITHIEAQLAHQASHTTRMFRQCFLNTLHTTVELLEDGTTFVMTGDIPAMWLRDSSAQIHPYLPFAREDEMIRRLICGTIFRHAHYLQIDPYANAFNRDANSHGHQTDHTAQTPWTWERKFELDSLCYPVWLLHDYFTATGDESVFNADVHAMLHTIVQTMQTEQQHDLLSPYRFERDDILLPSDTLPFAGRGTRTNFTGMIWSGFRPSDDACKFGYLIPANMFAVVILGNLAQIAHQHYDDAALADRASRLRNEIQFGIETYAIVQHPHYGRMYAYETDGYGNYNLMDDANVPSLLSLPYLGYCQAEDPVYQNTRAFILSKANPYYYEGQYAQGIGSPHTPGEQVWHLSLIMQGLTSIDQAEQDKLVEMLVNTTAGTDFMHESFSPHNPEVYTRAWFAWANSLFGEFIYRWSSSKGDAAHGTTNHRA